MPNKIYTKDAKDKLGKTCYEFWLFNNFNMRTGISNQIFVKDTKQHRLHLVYIKFAKLMQM